MNESTESKGRRPRVYPPATKTLVLQRRKDRADAAQGTLRRYAGAFRTPRGLIGLIIFLVMVGAALSTPLIFPGGYDVQGPDAFQAPSILHPLGTDELGRDLLVRTLFGLRTDFSIILIAVPSSMILGTALGLLGAVSKLAGVVVQRMLDIILGFPGVILGICIALIMGPGWGALVVAIAIAGLPFFGRQARGALLEQMNREYVTAARALGVGRGTVLFRHILPNAVDPILISGGLFMVVAVFIEAGLSIIGLGIQPPQPSLGSLLNVGMRFVEQNALYVIGPTVVLILLTLAFSLLADAMNETVNRK